MFPNLLTHKFLRGIIYPQERTFVPLLQNTYCGGEDVVRLSRKDLKNIADRVLRAYQELPSLKGAEWYKVDPVIMAEELLGINVEHIHLSLDRSILGMTAYGNAWVHVYDEEYEDLYMDMDGKVIMIESDLLMDVSMRGRYNFTVAHEVAHQILNMLFPLETGANAYVHRYVTRQEHAISPDDWEEWQANVLASFLLMPEILVRKGMFLFELGEKIPRLNKVYYPDTYNRFSNLADFLGTSKQALALSMQRYGLLVHADLRNPRTIIDVEMEEYA